MRRITQNAEKHNLPTARSAIRMAWQTLSDPKLLKGKRLITLPDIIRTDELRKGLNHEHYRDAYLNLQGAIEQLPELDVAPEEREPVPSAILQTLLLWVLSLPDNLRDGLTAQEVAEAAWLHDDAVGATAQAEHLLEMLVQNGFPSPQRKRSRAAAKRSSSIPTRLSVVQAQPGQVLRAAQEEVQCRTPSARTTNGLESLFWDLPDITPEAQAELGVNGGIFAAVRSARPAFGDKNARTGKPPIYHSRTDRRLDATRPSRSHTAARSSSRTGGATSSATKSRTPTSTSAWSILTAKPTTTTTRSPAR